MQKKKEKLFSNGSIRGIPGQYPLTDGMVFKIGRNLCQYLYYKRNRKAGKPRVIIAEDNQIRVSRVKTLLINAFSSSGIDVLLAGVTSISKISSLITHHKADLGVVILSGNNNHQDNEIKFFNSQGKNISDSDQEWIEDIIFNNLIQNSNSVSFGQDSQVIDITGYKGTRHKSQVGRGDDGF